MSDLKPNAEPIVLCREGTVRIDITVGGLHVHEFKHSTGVQKVQVAEHALFRVNTPVTCTDVWQGMRQPQTTYEPGDLQFLPAGTDLSTAYLSRPYSETLIRIPHRMIEDAAHGIIDLSQYELHYTRIPREETIGLMVAVRNMALAKHAGRAVREQAELALVQTLATTFIDGVVDRVRRWGTPRKSVPSHQAGILRALELIDAKMDDTITLRDLADVAAMSTSHFCRAFKASTGMSPARYVWTRRVDRARQLLRDRARPIIDVALDCGFSTQSHFSHTFKQATGLTPREFRRVAQ